MIKNIFETVLLLITQPAKAWTIIAKREETHQEYLTRFVYPLIALTTFSAFLGKLHIHNENAMPLALKESTAVLTSLLGGFYVASFTLKQIVTRWFPTIKGDVRFFQRYVGYASSITFLIISILELIPDFFFVKIAELYVIYIVWESIGAFVQLDEKKRITFTATVSALILLSPFVVEKILLTLMPGMNAI